MFILDATKHKPPLKGAVDQVPAPRRVDPWRVYLSIRQIANPLGWERPQVVKALQRVRCPIEKAPGSFLAGSVRLVYLQKLWPGKF